MPQSPKSIFNAFRVTLRAQPRRHFFWTYCGALALALGALGGDASAAQEAGGAGSSAEQAAPAASKRPAPTPAQRLERAKRRAEIAAKKAAARPVDETSQRVATALGQIAAALESGQLNSEEAFARIDEVKKSWVLLKRREGAAAGTPAVAKPGAAEPARPGPAAANAAAAARRKAARLKRANAKAVPAAAPRTAPVSVQSAPTPEENLSRLVANYNAAEKTLNQRVAAGEITRQSATRQLEKIRSELKVAYNAVTAGDSPEETVRYKDRARDLAREVARGLTSERDAQRELRLLSKAIAAEMDVKKVNAKQNKAAQQKRALEQRKINEQKRADRKKKAARQPNR